MATETEITSFINEMSPPVVAEANRRIANGEAYNTSANFRAYNSKAESVLLNCK